LVEFVNIYNLFETQNVINLNMYSDVAKGGEPGPFWGRHSFD